jgi:ankyrin repeat protein
MTQQTKGYGTVEEYDNQGIHMTVFVDGIDNARLILTHATALHVAAISGDSENAIALINRGANIKQIEGSGYTPLHLACITMNYGVAKVLVDHGAEINVSDGQDETPLRACLNSKSTRDKTALIAFLRQRGGHE